MKEGIRLDYDRLLNIIAEAGRLLIEHGAEIYRVEETMVRLCESFEHVEKADSFVLPTGIMLSLQAQNQTYTRILRVHYKELNLDVIDRINTLSREAVKHPFTIEELETKINELTKVPSLSIKKQLLGSCIGAFGFALFFQGNIWEAMTSLFIAIVIVLVKNFLNKLEIHSFMNQLICAACAALCARTFDLYFTLREDILIISSIMLLVPGLAITNAIRDTMRTDYVSGVAKAMEALISAVAIALGIVLVLTLYKG